MTMSNKKPGFRMLGIDDLDLVADIDRRSGGISRHGFIRKRLLSQKVHPDAFVSMAATSGDTLTGIVFCHIIDGEFGGRERVAVLDAIGVDPNCQGGGLGHQMLRNLIAELNQRGGRELKTQARWNQRGLIDFFSNAGFTLAPRMVLECGTDAEADILRTGDDPDELYRSTSAVNRGMQNPDVEIDFSDSSADDFAALSRDRIPVRSLRDNDLNAIIRIDRKINGQDRADYFQRKFSEVLEESGVRISLVAEIDDEVAGFIMARVDYGEFGRTSTVAVFDNIAITPSARGRRVGTALMGQLLANLRTLRVQVARTEVAWNQFELNGFLDRCGFFPAAQLSLSQRIN